MASWTPIAAWCVGLCQSPVHVCLAAHIRTAWSNAYAVAASRRPERSKCLGEDAGGCAAAPATEYMRAHL
eukprot:1237399-Alexandrium_andersonii.AAC.1